MAIEITTLSTAPLIYFNHNAQSLEAAWKYLLVCSLGIALALLGTFFLALSGAGPDGPRSLLLDDLVRAGPQLSRPWVRAAFVFLLVGYGTKMGLAPLHSWKPDAYGEAPGLLGALLAGGVTNFAFLSVVRVFQVTSAAGEGAFARDALVGIGLLSMALAAVFMVGQRDFKRMLAYSSVEHMGILARGAGPGRRGGDRAPSTTCSTTGSPRECSSWPRATSTARTGRSGSTTFAARPAAFRSPGRSSWPASWR